ncbi:hypothetical protein NBRC116495_27290 [Aurantivibrio plasticivorans]
MNLVRVSCLWIFALACINCKAECDYYDEEALCFEISNSAEFSILGKTAEIADLDSDGLLDIVAIEEDVSGNEALFIYRGKECISPSDSFCFQSPKETSIYDVSGFSLVDLNGDGNLDIQAKTATSNLENYLRVIKVPDVPPNRPSEFVSLLYTHGLVPESYSASTTYSDGNGTGYEAAGAFDGYLHNQSTPFLVEAGGQRYGIGTWTSRQGSHNTDQWLQIEFTVDTMVESVQLFQRSGFPLRMPRDVTIQYSANGIHFIDHESLSFAGHDGELMTLETHTPYVRFLRLYMHGTQGDTDYLQFSELLLKGWTDDS